MHYNRYYFDYLYLILITNRYLNDCDIGHVFNLEPLLIFLYRSKIKFLKSKQFLFS